MILVFGQTGQLARALTTALPSAMFLSRKQADLRDNCARPIQSLMPSAVINVAASTDIDIEATQVNGHAPGQMAAACASMNIPFLHISTDYVFDGTANEPYVPNALCNPQTPYGRSKYLGEQEVQAQGGQSLILRTSWLFDGHSRNFVTSILNTERPEIEVVTDQIGGPTPVMYLARALCVIIHRMIMDPTVSGIYHYSGAPYVSRAQFARAILESYDLPKTIKGIPSEALNSSILRPKNCRLECEATWTDFGLRPPNWRLILDQMSQKSREQISSLRRA